MVPVVTQASLVWLVACAGLFAVVGFLVSVGRGFSGRERWYRALSRTGLVPPAGHRSSTAHDGELWSTR
jgi:hypothetical protein